MSKNKTSINVALEAYPGDKVFVIQGDQVRKAVVKEVVIKVTPSDGPPRGVKLYQQLTVVIATPGLQFTETRYPSGVGATQAELFEKLERQLKEGH